MRLQFKVSLLLGKKIEKVYWLSPVPLTLASNEVNRRSWVAVSFSMPVTGLNSVLKRIFTLVSILGKMQLFSGCVLVIFSQITGNRNRRRHKSIRQISVDRLEMRGS